MQQLILAHSSRMISLVVEALRYITMVSQHSPNFRASSQLKFPCKISLGVVPEGLGKGYDWHACNRLLSPGQLLDTWG